MASKTQTWLYVVVVAGCFALGILVGWSPIARRIDNSAYDVIMRRSAAPQGAAESIVVEIEPSQSGLRSILAQALSTVAAAHPKTVAVDVLLPDAGRLPADDAALEQAMRDTPNLILACRAGTGKFEDPLPRFGALARGVGHVNLDHDRTDAVGRQIPLEEAGGGERRWALSLEAFRIAHDAAIVESPGDLEVGSIVIPAARESGREMLIRYLPEDVTTLSVLDAAQHPERLRGKTVFVGETDLSTTDRVLDPYERNLPGVKVHAYAYETLARGEFLRHAGNSLELLIPAASAVAAGLIFAFTASWISYALIVLLLTAAHWLVPMELFRHGIVLSYFAPVAVTWLCSAGAGAYQHLVVRRQLRKTESEKSRYQQAMHWAAHEMRTPLTAIQGSSEIMSRYNLPEAKRNQLSEMINSESKRLSRIIQTFLDVERLAEGQMELKREPFEAAKIVDSCLLRVIPLAERKQIAIHLDNEIAGTLVGDRELMEYAFYNLLTNAVKYSPAQTEIHVFSQLKDEELRISVKDQGIGMDSKEIKNIFRKFYRTKRAEASGEVGTGIGLSIVEQIVTHHKGRIDVTSEPGKGSCFTMVLNAQFSASRNVQTADRRG